MPGMDQERRYYAPEQAAGQLAVSGAGLRRLAVIYERVHGDLPRDQRSGRLWTQEAIERLARAREMVQGGRAPSVDAALRAEAAGEDADPWPVPRSAARDDLAPLVEELRRLREAVEVQGETLARLEEENRALRQALPAAPEEAEPPSQVSRPWWRRLIGR